MTDPIPDDIRDKACRIAAWVLFGRPMECLDRRLFVDVVSSREVGVYRDRRTSKTYMANGPWALFRVEVSRVSFR